MQPSISSPASRSVSVERRVRSVSPAASSTAAGPCVGRLVLPWLSWAALAALLPAQRDQARIAHGRAECVIDYGTPSWGAHSLDELPVGGTWRLGSNEATSWRTAAPILQGDVLLPPGAYRVKLGRRTKDVFTVTFDEAALALGRTGDVLLVCTRVADATTPSKKLALALAKAAGNAQDGGAAGTPGAQRTHLDVRFGPHQLAAEFDLLAGEELAASAKYRLVGWSLPATVVDQRLDKGEPVIVATFVPKQKPRHQDPALFNVVVTADAAEVVPGLLMPEDSFGFGKVAPPDPAWRRPGSLAWEELATPATGFELKGRADRKEKCFVLELRCGKRSGVVKVTEPRNAE